jgi:hypothetical protein
MKYTTAKALQSASAQAKDVALCQLQEQITTLTAGRVCLSFSVIPSHSAGFHFIEADQTTRQEHGQGPHGPSGISLHL